MKRYLETASALSLVIAAGFALTAPAYGNPEDGVVAAGSASISPSGKKLDVHQSSDRVVIDWRKFDIAPDEHTEFHQPNSSSFALNRVSSGDPSQIMGRLSANGNIMIINPSGVLFGANSRVDVNGLVATSSDISNSNFMSGNMSFDTPGNVDAAIINEGAITAGQAGLVGLVAPQAENRGTITARLGKVHMEAGDRFSVDLYGDGLINVTLDDQTNAQIKNSGTITAEGGHIKLSAAAGGQMVNRLVDIQGELSTASVSQKGGTITISGDVVGNVGIVDSSGTEGGTVTMAARNLAQQGTVKAEGKSGRGGTVNLTFKERYIDSEQSLTSVAAHGANGGSIKVGGDQGSHAMISGHYSASSATHKGGTVALTAKDGDLKLYGAHVEANGAQGGGTILTGGDYQGSGTLAHAKSTKVNYATTLSAKATSSGDGGTVIVWSDEETLFGGKAYAMGGALSGDGGLIEISSKDLLQIAGNSTTDASAVNGTAGQLLLDPKNITIATGGISGNGISYFEVIDPNPDAGQYGSLILTLSNGNVVVRDADDDFAATNGGAVYLFNGVTGALISTLYGTSNTDQIGNGGIQAVGTGNFIVRSSAWDNGAISNAGALTWVNGTTGLSGAVGAANSLVGSTAVDAIGGTVMILSNGDYVSLAASWDNGGTANVGAVTLIGGNSGLTGTISAANSLIGNSAGDQVGVGFLELTNGNLVVTSPNWDNGGTADVGAVTWIDRTLGTSGVVSAANSLIGTFASDMTGSGGIVALTNGNYVVVSRDWNGTRGASTWGNGSTGTTGLVDATTSWVGSSVGDGLSKAVLTLTNGNYVISTPYWDGGVLDAGAVTWADGSAASNGTIGMANSLYGTTNSDRVGSGGMLRLDNGNFVVLSNEWDNAGAVNAGAVTWVNGLTGLTGAVSAANSMVGSRAGDLVGGFGAITLLQNSNFLISSSSWDNGFTINTGAVTWVDGSIGRSGAIDATNSLVGTTANDLVGGFGSIRLLSNGNYIVTSPNWDNGGAVNAGAVTWASGAGGIVGAVSAANSLVGSNASDRVGSQVMTLDTGNYIVSSQDWRNGGAGSAGAVTFGDGTTGIVGAVSAANSLVGTTANDMVGQSVIPLTNGNYVVLSSNWDNGGTANVGAVTWVDATVGLTGAVSAANSLIGALANDSIGNGGYLVLTNGNYVVRSPNANIGGVANAGAVTWGSATSGMTGVVSAANSLVGSTASDGVGLIGILANGNYFVDSPNWDDGATVNAGAFTIGDGTNGTSGVITAANSLIGSAANSGLALPSGIDNTNQRIYVRFSNLQRLYSVSMQPAVLGNFDGYTDIPGGSVILAPSFITNVLNAGTNVTLQANNDITLSNDLIVNNAGGDGGTLTFQAGRSILLNADIFTDNGDLNIFANEDLATGVVDAHRDAGNAAITMGAGAEINAGTGDVVFRLDDGTGKTNSAAGSITLRDVTANTILAWNKNATGDIILEGGGLTAAAGAGTSITLASARNFINNVGAAALTVAPGGRFLVYSTDPALDTLNTLTSDFVTYSCIYGGACPAFPATTNGFLYSIADPTPPPAGGGGGGGSAGGGGFTLPSTYLFESQVPYVVSLSYAPTVMRVATRSLERSAEEAMLDLTFSVGLSPRMVYGPVTSDSWLIVIPPLTQWLNLSPFFYEDAYDPKARRTVVAVTYDSTQRI